MERCHSDEASEICHLTFRPIFGGFCGLWSCAFKIHPGLSWSRVVERISSLGLGSLAPFSSARRAASQLSIRSARIQRTSVWCWESGEGCSMRETRRNHLASVGFGWFRLCFRVLVPLQTHGKTQTLAVDGLIDVPITRLVPLYLLSSSTQSKHARRIQYQNLLRYAHHRPSHGLQNPHQEHLYRH